MLSTAVIAGLGIAGLQQATSAATWVPTGAGTFNWTDGVNWDTNPTVPNGSGAVANFNIALTAAQTVSPGTVTAGSLTFGSTTNFTQTFGAFNGDGTVTMNNGGAGATIAYNGVPTSNIFRSNLTLADNLTVSVISGKTARFQGGLTISGTGNITKTGPGTMYIDGTTAGLAGMLDIQQGKVQLSGANNSTCWAGGALKLGGTLQMLDFDAIGDSVPVIYNGGYLNTGGNPDTVGTMQLLANSGTNTGGEFHYANSSAVAWTPGTILTVEFGTAVSETAKLFVGTDTTGLTPTQLSQIWWQELDAAFDPLGSPIQGSMWGPNNDGEVVPAVPEPAALSLLALGAFGVLRRRRA